MLFRLSVVISALWFVFVLAASSTMADPIAIILVIGIIPLMLTWGIWWVITGKAAPSRPLQRGQTLQLRESLSGSEVSAARAIDFVSRSRRCVTLLVDLAIIFGLCSAVWPVLEHYGVVLDEDRTRWIGLLVVVLYYSTFEYVTGRTVGKVVTRTKVVTTEGSPPRLYSSIVRSLCRIIPLEPLTIFGNIPCAAHDTWSGSIVVASHYTKEDVASLLSGKPKASHRSHLLRIVLPLMLLAIVCIIAVRSLGSILARTEKEGSRKTSTTPTSNIDKLRMEYDQSPSSFKNNIARMFESSMLKEKNDIKVTRVAVSNTSKHFTLTLDYMGTYTFSDTGAEPVTARMVRWFDVFGMTQLELLCLDRMTRCDGFRETSSILSPFLQADNQTTLEKTGLLKNINCENPTIVTDADGDSSSEVCSDGAGKVLTLSRVPEKIISKTSR